MASSSSSPTLHNICKTKVLNGHDHVQQVEEKATADENDLLELRLGRGFGLCSKKVYMGSSSSSSSCSCSSFPLKQPKLQQTGLDLGLDLGLGIDHCRRNIYSTQSSFMSPDLDCPSYRRADPDHAFSCTMPELPPTMPFRSRPQPAGLWFTLRSSADGKREMSLPQIPKMYIRVKDDNVTVLMVKTYLVTKLGLSNESEIEILCKGQRLMSSQMLKYVRDTIWLPRFMESAIKSGASMAISISNGVPVNHLMCLDYERKC